MKANRAIRDERAEVGVGTLIVFIAMVLVAAVAAAVLINTTGTLQQRAQATGQEATQEVSSNLKVVGVYGIVVGSEIEDVRVHVQLAAGALPMDLEQLVLRYSDGTSAATFNYEFAEKFDDGGVCDGAGTAVDSGAAGIVEVSFLTQWLRPTPDATNDHGCAGKSVMEPGDLVELQFTLDAARALPVRTNAFLSLIPETGSAIEANFRTPATYSGDTYITLR